MSEENRTADFTDASPEEAQLAEKLRDELHADLWIAGLRNAANPTQLSAEEHAHLVAEALAFAPTEEELASAKAFRDELETGTGDAALVQEALRAALGEVVERKPLDVRAGVEDALARKPVSTNERGRVLPFRRPALVSGAGIVMALAAAFLLYVQGRQTSLSPSVTAALSVNAALVPARSTQDLFDEPFKTQKPGQAAFEGQGASRIDRIAAARTSDYRSNRFARWGVK